MVIMVEEEVVMAEDTYEQTLEKVRNKVKNLFIDQYKEAVNKEQVFNRVVDIMVKEAGSFTLLQIIIGLR